MHVHFSGDEMKTMLKEFADSDSLRELETRLRRVNLFEVLGVSRYEIRHSNFLAWLLSPEESHGLGDRFLREFVRDAFGDAAATFPESKTTQILREAYNIDLLVVFPSQRQVLVIENKLDSTEHSDQLRRYREVVALHYPGFKCDHLYLTIDGDDASDPNWRTYSYRRLHDLLTTALKRLPTVDLEVGIILDHYLQLLKREFMNDPDVEQLCREIYRNHRQAIDVIIRNVRIIQAEPLRLISEKLRARGWHQFSFQASKGWLGTCPPSWLEQLPPLYHEAVGRDPRSWLTVWFNVEAEQINWSIWLAEVEDQSTVNQALRGLQNSDGVLRLGRRGITPSSRRAIYSEQFIRLGLSDSSADAPSEEELDIALESLCKRVEKAAFFGPR